jgi:WD40 repeat protein
MQQPQRPEISLQKRNVYAGHTGSVFALSVSADGQRLLSSGDDGLVAAWDLAKETDSGKGLLRTGKSVYCLLDLGPRALIVAGTSDGTVYFVDPGQNSVLHTYRKGTDPIYNLFWDEGRDAVWVLHGGGLLSIISLSDYSEIWAGRLAADHLRSICADTRGDKLFIGSSDNRIIVMDRHNLKPVHSWEAHSNSVFALAVHPEAHYLLSGGRDAHLNVWDLRQDYRLIRSIPAHNFTVNDIAFSPSLDHFATASRDKTIKVWDAWTFELLKVIDFARNEAHQHSVNKIRWLAGDNSVISCSDDRSIIRWNTEILPHSNSTHS